VVGNNVEIRTEFASEDLMRVRRLTEELKSRLFELGLIVGRTLGHSSATAVKYEARQDSDRPEQTIDVVVVKLPDGTFCCSVDPPGESICPC
jgi:hypothetical protein